MIAVVQRVSEAAVDVAGERISEIGSGFLVLLGVARGDAEADAEYTADKVIGLRVFEDGQGKLNLGLHDVHGAVLVVSQFTLLGDCRKGRRPSFIEAAEPADAERLYRVFVKRVEAAGIMVKTGRFREVMEVRLNNNGPVTLLLDSKKRF